MIEGKGRSWRGPRMVYFLIGWPIPLKKMEKILKYDLAFPLFLMSQGEGGPHHMLIAFGILHYAPHGLEVSKMPQGPMMSPRHLIYTLVEYYVHRTITK